MREWNVIFYHTLREANSCVDFFVNIRAKQMIEFYIWDSPSMGFSHLLFIDFIGAS